MSVLQLFSNNAISLLENNLGPLSTSINLQPGAGALFPLPTLPSEFFLVTLEDITNPNIREIIRIKERVGDVLNFDITDRGQEDTTARSWIAGNTLVDHRITAETIKRAFLEPQNTSNSLILADEDINISTAVSRINFVGDGVTTTAAGSNITVNIPGSVGGSGVGYEYSPIIVVPSQNESIGKVTYSNFKRGNKFWVSMVDPISGNAQSFEVLTIVQGLISSNTETVTWTRSNRIGYNFLGHLEVSLNTTINELSVNWHNTEPLSSVVVTVVRI